eukprot:358554-Chlamydomonas_euryale.AAC.6
MVWKPTTYCAGRWVLRCHPQITLAFMPNMGGACYKQAMPVARESGEVWAGWPPMCDLASAYEQPPVADWVDQTGRPAPAPCISDCTGCELFCFVQARWHLWGCANPQHTYDVPTFYAPYAKELLG